MLQISKSAKIFVVCPANFKTGGTELLHQLVFELGKTLKHCYMYYYDAKGCYPTNPAFLKYNAKFLRSIDEYDHRDNVLIVPETSTECLYHFKHIQKVIWWLSVDNYFVILKEKQWNDFDSLLDKLLFEPMFRFGLDKNHYFHLAQSHYALTFLKKHKIKHYDYLSDYINSIYFEENCDSKREDIVLYNPKKGAEFTQKLISHLPHINFVPLINLTNEEVRNLLIRSKLYIDFGEHPGKDRFPREAAISGCCVITGLQGAANNDKDIPIPSEFKFTQVESNIPNITKQILNCLEHYEEINENFESYRSMIKSEEEQFRRDVARIFSITDKRQIQR